MSAIRCADRREVPGRCTASTAPGWVTPPRRSRSASIAVRAVCHDHAYVAARWLTRTAIINRTAAVEPPARIIRCGLCQQARDAAAGQQSRPVQRRGRS